MYETGKIEILVSNPFEEDAEFNITVKNINKIKSKSQGDKKKNKKHKGGKKEGFQRKYMEVESLVPMFFTKQNKIKIKRGKVVKLIIYYLPLTFEPHIAYICKSSYFY